MNPTMDAEAAAQIEELLVLCEGMAALAKRGRQKSRQSDDEDVRRLIAIGGAAVAALAAKLDAGSITHEEFVTQALAVLSQHAQTAASIGAGQFDGTVDSDVIDGLTDGQTDYLDGFADDIDGGGMSAAQIAARAALYGGVIWTALQMGKGHGAQQAGVEQCYWDLDAEAQHCEDCPSIADGSPYVYPDELPTFPGQDVACQSNCRCALRFELDDSDKAAPVMLVKDVRCPQCHKLLGRSVNVGAELWCQRCRAGRIVTA